jgi:hypothetical protein
MGNVINEFTDDMSITHQDDLNRLNESVIFARSVHIISTSWKTSWQNFISFTILSSWLWDVLKNDGGQHVHTSFVFFYFDLR